MASRNMAKYLKKVVEPTKRPAAAQTDIQEAAACQGKAIGGAEMATGQSRIIG